MSSSDRPGVVFRGAPSEPGDYLDEEPPGLVTLRRADGRPVMVTSRAALEQAGILEPGEVLEPPPAPSSRPRVRVVEAPGVRRRKGWRKPSKPKRAP